MKGKDAKSVELAFEALVGGLAHPANTRMSSEDRKAFEMEIAALEARVAALERDTKNYVASLKRARNASAPINLLPLELLHAIFCEVYRERQPYRYLQPLTLVCKDWYDAARECPQLWTRISLDLPPRTLTTFLQRSKNSGLEIEHTYDEGKRLSGRRTPFLRAIAEHAHYWKSCGVVVENPPDLILLERSAAPLVQSLEVECLKENTIAVNLFQGQSPLLTRLKLKRVAILWDSLVCCRLKSISISDIQAANCPTIYQVLNILQTLPLSSFSFTTVPIVASGEAITSTNPTFLASMKDFTLCDIPLSAINQLLHLLEFPQCVLSIYPSETHRSIGTGEDIGLRKLLDWLIRWENFGSVHDGDWLEFGWGSSSSLGLGGWGVSNSALLLWILETLGPNFSKHVTSLILYARGDWEDHVLDILNHFPNPTTLELVNFGRNLRHVLDPLGEPRFDESGATLQWLCPDLHYMRIYACDNVNPKDLIRLVRSRCGHTSSSSEDVLNPLPKPFRSLTVEDTFIPHPKAEILRQLLGEDVFRCDNTDTES